MRLALALALNGSIITTALFTIAVVCSTWSAVNLATSKRDTLTPYGDVSLPSVRSANRMVARTGFPYLMIMGNGCVLKMTPQYL